MFEDVAPSSGLILVVVAAWLGLVYESGRRLGLRRTEGRVARGPHAEHVLGGLLTLMAFFLGVSVGVAESHDTARRQLVLEEANAAVAVNRYVRSLPDPYAAQARDLLREYVDHRITGSSYDDVEQRIARSNVLGRALWAVVARAVADDDSEVAKRSLAHVDDLIRLGHERNVTGLTYRIPGVILLALLGVTTLALFAMGYSAGLQRSGDAVLSVAVVLAVAFALALVVELDRPQARTALSEQGPLIEVREALDAQREVAPR